jgi:hypothetical protein
MEARIVTVKIMKFDGRTDRLGPGISTFLGSRFLQIG